MKALLMSIDLSAQVLEALIWMLPAYVANAAPVVVARACRLRGELHPLDGGLVVWDGRRLFGENKTVEGFVGGLAGGSLASALLELFKLHTVWEGFVLSMGALLGDLLGAFIKRRLGLAPGAPAPLLDQLDFVFGSMALRSLVFGYVSWERIAIVVAITPLLHLATNAVAYALGLKKHPW